LNPKTEKLRSGKASCTSTEETVCTMNKIVSSERQATSTSGSRLENCEPILSRENHCERADNTLRNVRKVYPKKGRPSKSKQK